VKTRF